MRRPKNRPCGDDSDPGLAPRRDSDLGFCHATDKGTLKPAWTASVRKGVGAQRPHCAKGRNPRTPTSWRHFLLRVVAATAGAQWTDGWGSSTYVLALFVCGRHSVHRQSAELPCCPSTTWYPHPAWICQRPKSSSGRYHIIFLETVYGCVVDGIQLRIPQCEEDNLEALGEIIETVAVGHLTEKKLVENRRHAGEVVSSVGDTRHLRAYLV